MLSKTATHALHAVTALARIAPQTYAGAADLAHAIDAPPNYLGKLLRLLADEGLLESQKGKRGGFRLAKSPDRIAIYDVVEPIDHVSRWKGCFLGRSRCASDVGCPVHRRWGPVRDDYLRFLRETCVAELAGHAGGTRP